MEQESEVVLDDVWLGVMTGISIPFKGTVSYGGSLLFYFPVTRLIQGSWEATPGQYTSLTSLEPMPCVPPPPVGKKWCSQ